MVNNPKSNNIKRSLRTALCIILLLLLLTGCQEKKVEIYTGTVEELSRLYAADFREKKISNLSKKYPLTSEVRQALTAQGWAAIYLQLDEMAGKFVAEKSVNFHQAEGFTYAEVIMQYEKTDILLTLVWNGFPELAGMFFKPLATLRVGEPLFLGDESQPLEAAIVYGESPTGKRTPALIIVPGSGPSDINGTVVGNPTYADWAEAFAAEGITVLRYAKRTATYGQNLSYAINTPVDEYERDLLDAYNYLLTDERIDPEAIFLLGHSQGGNMLPYLATKCDIRGAIMVAANYSDLLELGINQLKYLLTLESLKKNQEMLRQELQRLMDAALQIAKSGGVSLSENILDLPVSYWRFMNEYVPEDYLLENKYPLLLVYGDRDYQVPESEMNLWKKLLFNRQDTEFALYPGLNHLMQYGEGEAGPDEYAKLLPVSEKFIKGVSEFVWKRCE